MELGSCLHVRDSQRGAVAAMAALARSCCSSRRRLAFSPNACGGFAPVPMPRYRPSYWGPQGKIAAPSNGSSKIASYPLQYERGLKMWLLAPQVFLLGGGFPTTAPCSMAPGRRGPALDLEGGHSIAFGRRALPFTRVCTWAQRHCTRKADIPLHSEGGPSLLPASWTLLITQPVDPLDYPPRGPRTATRLPTKH